MVLTQAWSTFVDYANFHFPPEPNGFYGMKRFGKSGLAKLHVNCQLPVRKATVRCLGGNVIESVPAK